MNDYSFSSEMLRLLTEYYSKIDRDFICLSDEIISVVNDLSDIVESSDKIDINFFNNTSLSKDDIRIVTFIMCIILAKQKDMYSIMFYIQYKDTFTYESIIENISGTQRSITKSSIIFDNNSSITFIFNNLRGHGCSLLLVDGTINHKDENYLYVSKNCIYI